MTQLRPSWQRPGRPGSAIAGAWWTSPWCCGTAVCAARRPPPSLVRNRSLGRRQRPSAHRGEHSRSDRRGRGGVPHPPGHGRPGRAPAAPRRCESVRLRDDGQDDQTARLRGRVWSSGSTAIATIIRGRSTWARAAVLQRHARRGGAFSRSLELDSALAGSTQSGTSLELYAGALPAIMDFNGHTDFR